MTEPERPASAGIALALGLLTFVWLVGTPVLGYGALIMSAAFFGETPSVEDAATAERLMVGALLCGFGAPLLAAALALRHGRRGMGLAFFAAAALTGGLLALLALG